MSCDGVGAPRVISQKLHAHTLTHRQRLRVVYACLCLCVHVLDVLDVLDVLHVWMCCMCGRVCTYLFAQDKKLQGRKCIANEAMRDGGSQV